MPLDECFMLMGMGGLFILLGLGALIWGRTEADDYYDSLSNRNDVREFLEHSPEHPEPTALKVGGWIAIIAGLLILVMGGVFWLWG